MEKDHPIISLSAEHPLDVVSVSVDIDKYLLLLKKMSKGRKLNAGVVCISGGVAYGTNTNSNTPTLLSFLPHKMKNPLYVKGFLKKWDSLFYGGLYRRHLKRIILFPETKLLSLLLDERDVHDGNLKKIDLNKIKKTLQSEVSITLIEELEHAHQDMSSWRYFFDGNEKKSAFLNTYFYLVYGFFGGYVVTSYMLLKTFNPKVAIGLGLLTAFPRTLQMIHLFFPYPEKIRKLFYKSSKIEIDAKKVASNSQLIELAKEAIQIQIDLPEEKLKEWATCWKYV